MKIEYVVDASAVLALLHREPGEAAVKAALGRSAISAVNASEVLTKLIRKGSTDGDALRDLEALAFDIVAFDADLAFSAAALTNCTSAHGLSFGDRACLATAKTLKASALTADRNWKIPSLGIPVKFIR